MRVLKLLNIILIGHVYFSLQLMLIIPCNVIIKENVCHKKDKIVVSY